MKLPITKKQLIFELVSYIICIAALALAIVFVIQNPQEVPVNYDFDGEVTKYGSSKTILFLPITMLVMCIFMSLIIHLLPVQYMNVGVNIKPGREFLIYRDLTWIFVSQLFSFSLFSVADVAMTFFGLGGYMGIGALIFMAVIFVSIGICFSMMQKHNR